MGKLRWTTLGLILVTATATIFLTVGGCPPGSGITINLGNGGDNSGDDPNSDDMQGGNGGNGDHNGGRRPEFEKLDDCGMQSVQNLPQSGMFLQVQHPFDVNVISSSGAGLEALIKHPDCDPNAPRQQFSEQRPQPEQMTVFEMGANGVVAAIHNLFRGLDGRKLYATSPRTGGLQFVLFDGCMELISDEFDSQEFDDDFDPNEFDPNDYDPNDPNNPFEDLETPFGDPTAFFQGEDDSELCGDNATQLLGGDPNDPNNLDAVVGICVSIEVLGECRECMMTDQGWQETYRIRVQWTALDSGTLLTPCGREVDIEEGDEVIAELLFNTFYKIVGSPETMGYAPVMFGDQFDPNQFGFDPNNFDPNDFDPNYFDPNVFDPNSFDPNMFDPNEFFSDPNDLFDDPNDFDEFDPNEFGF